jgi:hypothetical protein
MAGKYNYTAVSQRTDDGAGGGITFDFSSGLDDRMPGEAKNDVWIKEKVLEILKSAIYNVSESADGLLRIFTTSPPQGKELTKVVANLQKSLPGTTIALVRNKVSQVDEWRVSVPIFYSRKRLFTRTLQAFMFLLVFVICVCGVYLYMRVFKYEDGWDIIWTHVGNAMRVTTLGQRCLDNWYGE